MIVLKSKIVIKNKYAIQIAMDINPVIKAIILGLPVVIDNHLKV